MISIDYFLLTGGIEFSEASLIFVINVSPTSNPAIANAPAETDSSSHHRPSRGSPIYTNLQSPKHKRSAAGKLMPPPRTWDKHR